ncbi:hypothetical protein [Polyangium aurulentum]|uniref:hypothetical protein n=1 Tax=Polyangium aurulentum TaxID=2567896 RepID=UPI0010AE4BF0|nr:hypothetical protein [Polyangium aurulentum]UQA62200.1 hypothetical protein E8A73_017720 [Polyangium aurulentum]
MRHLAASILLAAIATVAACGDDRNADRPVTDLNGVPYGATCNGEGDCGGGTDSCCIGGKCSADGWCSPKCASDQDCPEGFFCIDHSGTRCFAACSDDRDCPIDWICEDKSGHKTCRYK